MSFDRRDLLLAGVGTAAVMAAARANADTPFTQFNYPIANQAGSVPTGATNRNTPARFADCYNVLDFGADPTNTNNSSPAIQACFDAAFGPSTAPNGINAIANKAVYIPAGQYKLLSTLNLTSVMGAHIFGDSRQATILSLQTGLSTDAVIRTDGCMYSKFERISFSIASNATVGTCFDLDRATSGNPINLQSNTFEDCNFGTGAVGLLINKTVAGSSMGSENSIINCYFIGAPGNTTFSGLKVVGQNALMNAVYGGNFSACNIGIEVPTGGGSVPIIHGVSFQNQAVPGAWDISVLTSSPDDYSIVGCRSETQQFAKIIAGANAQISGCNMWQTGGVSVQGDGGMVIAGCHVGGTFAGNMQLSLLNNLYNTANPLSGFGGLVTQFAGAPFTATSSNARSVFSLLPDPTKCTGLRYYIVDNSTNIVNNTSFGGTVAASGTIASFTASCNDGGTNPGTILTVSSNTGIAIGQLLRFPGVIPGTIITSGPVGNVWGVNLANLATAGTAMTTASMNVAPIWSDGVAWRVG